MTRILRIVLVVVWAVGSEAQRPRQLALGPTTARLDGGFSVLVRVLELADGRVLVPDGPGRRLLVADFATNRVEVIGRNGRGPGEYEMPGFPQALGNDSSLVVELLGRRWYVLHGARIVRTVPPDDPALTALRGTFSSADTLGHVLAKQTPLLEGEREITLRDSADLVLVERATGRVERVARLRRRPLREWRETDATGRVIRSGSAPTLASEAEEEALLMPDGWVAVTRLAPFRVDWRRPDGTWVRGAPLAVPVIRNTARERAARARRLGPQPAVPPALRMPTATGAAATLPPYDQGPFALLAGADGHLLVRRTPSADAEGTRYWVITRRGTLAGELVLPATEQIVGSGARGVYVAVKDADDVPWLERRGEVRP